MSDATDIYEERLPPEEFERRLKEALAALDGDEGTEMSELIDWFLRRYPTPLERLAYARRKYREAMRFQGIARPKGP